MNRNIVENIYELWQPHPSGPPGFRGSFRHKIPRIYFEVRFLTFYTVGKQRRQTRKDDRGANIYTTS